MNKYAVYSGEYPFDQLLGYVEVVKIDDKEMEAAMALTSAIKLFNSHVVVQPVFGPQ